MPVTVRGEKLPISADDMQRLWQATCRYTKHVDEDVAIKVVNEAESLRLNQAYRHRRTPTNVLTFSYPDEGEGATHDVALCLPVAEREAVERHVALREYIALLLVHAFLHAAGLDHERSASEALAMQQAEQAVLAAAGFSARHLA